MDAQPPQLMRFNYDALPSRVVFAAGCARSRLADELGALGLRRPLVIFAEPERALADELTALLGDVVADTFTEVRPHVPVEVAERARAAAAACGADGLLAIGGGSTTGTAKAVALESGLPIVAVPTTYAGSEMTPIWGLTTAARKTTGRDARVLPKVVLYDPELTLTLPPQIAGPSALNALAHSVEAFYAPGTNPICMLWAEAAIGAIARSLPSVVREPQRLPSREEILYGAYLSAAAFAVAGSGLHHKICHALGGRFDLPHAETHAIVLPQVLAFNETAMGDGAARIRRALGTADGESAALAVFELLEAVGAPTSLAAIGMPVDGIGLVLDEIVAAVPESNPRRASHDDVEGILRAAYAGRRPESDSPATEPRTTEARASTIRSEI